MKNPAYILSTAVFVCIMGYFLSGAMFLFLVFGGICYMIYHNTAVEDRKFVLALLVAGFAVRVLLAMVLHANAYMHNFHSISGDDLLYTIKSWALVHRWEAKPQSWAYVITSVSKGYGLNPFTYILAFFFKIFGFHPVAGKMINCIIGTMIGWVAYLAAKNMFDRRSARIAMILVMFYPSLIRWSAANLKDPLMILLFTACIYLFIDALNNKVAVWKYIVMVCSILLLFFFTQIFYFSLVMVGLVIMVLMKMLEIYLTRRWLKTAFIVLVISVFFAAAFYFIYVDTKPLIRILYMCSETQIAIAKSDNAGYDFYQADFMNNLNRGVIDVPLLLNTMFINVVYFMLTPFPWQMASYARLQALPQMLLWYVVLGLAVFGFFKLSLKRPQAAILMGVLLAIGIVVNSLAEGNVGAAFRHRDIFTPFFIILASAVLADLLYCNSGTTAPRNEDLE